jgi:hypothetical protein
MADIPGRFMYNKQLHINLTLVYFKGRIHRSVNYCKYNSLCRKRLLNIHSLIVPPVLSADLREPAVGWLEGGAR